MYSRLWYVLSAPHRLQSHDTRSRTWRQNLSVSRMITRPRCHSLTLASPDSGHLVEVSLHNRNTVRSEHVKGEGRGTPSHWHHTVLLTSQHKQTSDARYGQNQISTGFCGKRSNTGMPNVWLFQEKGECSWRNEERLCILFETLYVIEVLACKGDHHKHLSCMLQILYFPASRIPDTTHRAESTNQSRHS